MKTPISICTWSLLNDPGRVTTVMKESALKGLHLDASALDSFKHAIEANGWTISAMMIGFPQEDYSTLESIRSTGGIVPNTEWPQNLELALNAIRETAGMKVPYLSLHAGFIDHTDATGYTIVRNRIQQLADNAEEHGVSLLLETGQETADDLRDFLEELKHPAVAVNFDPANMILYGKGDPIDAIHILAPWIKHVHIKDAIASSIPGRWGEEVPWGEGEVNQDAFFNALNEIGYSGSVAIEREAGDQRERDIIHTAKQLEVKV